MHINAETGDPRRSGGSFVSGLLWGVAVGAALGMMFAPRKGADLRRDVAHSANRIRRQVAETYGGASDAVRDAVTRGQRAVNAGKAAFQNHRSDKGAAMSS